MKIPLAVEHRDGYSCLVVSDGAGGHGEGARAAQLAVGRVLEGFRSRPPVDGRDLAELLLDAHDAVLAGQRKRSVTASAAGMQATVVVLVIDSSKNVALWGHVGDSRLYHWREGRLTHVTRDDSVWQSVLDTGLVHAESARAVRHRGVLLAALGCAEEIAPHVSDPLEIKSTDAFLLCTDGWWDGLELPRISGLLTQAATPDLWLDAMIIPTREPADSRQDNYSAIACWIGESAPEPPCSPLQSTSIGP